MSNGNDIQILQLATSDVFQCLYNMLKQVLGNTMMKDTKYHTAGTVPTSNIKLVDRGKIDALNTHISWSLRGLGTGLWFLLMALRFT